jgi:hypothetical protein
MEIIMNNKSKRIVLSGLLIAVGLLLPFVTAHAFGAPGTILLPMHIPVFLIGFLCGPQYGVIGGFIIPVLSSILTGMPPVYPMLPVMIGELAVYGLLSGLLYKKIKLPIYPSLLIAMVCGRVVNALIFVALLTANNTNFKVMSILGGMVQGLPGIAVQLVIIPVIVVATNKFYLNENQAEANKTKENKTKENETKENKTKENEIKENGQEETLNQAIRMIKEEKASCVVIKNNAILHSKSGPGVAPLISLYENNPELLKEAFVVDKVIGKAAAMMTVLGGATRVYGIVMSTAAQAYLEKHGIIAEYGRCVEVISNRTGDGLCPLEKSVLDIEDAEAGYPILKETIRKLMKVV